MAAIWNQVRARLGEPSHGLERPDDLDAFLATGPLLAQICGPMAARRSHGVMVLGAFDAGLPGCPPGTYASHIVRRLRDGPVSTAAVNAFDSQSGWGALIEAGHGDRSLIVTGSHSASMRAVADGTADVAAIDALTWRLSPHPRLRVVATTRPTPAPPLVTTRADMAGTLRRHLADAAAALPVAKRRATGIRAFVPKTDADYAGMALPPPPSTSPARCIPSGIPA